MSPCLVGTMCFIYESASSFILFMVRKKLTRANIQLGDNKVRVARGNQSA